MAWLRIDDRVRTHPKIVQAGPVAAWLWLSGVCYCREHLTDGRIDKSMLPTLAPGLRNLRREAARLVEVGLWHEHDSHFEVHDFLDWNPSRNDVAAGKEWDRRRKELYADPTLVQNIRVRDGDHCRYCGKGVNWSDRRGPMGGQFDHVNPRGENTLDNIVVACRGCNIRKGGRTPDEAGMPLLPPKNPVPIQNGTSSESGSESSSSSRARAGARARAISGSSDQQDRFSRTTLHRPRHPDLITLGPVELWASQFQQLVSMAASSSGGDTTKADAEVRAWVADVDDGLIRDGAESSAIKQPRKFWQELAADRFGRKPNAARICSRHHTPPCTDEVACTARYQAELDRDRQAMKDRVRA